jgi:3-phenylpropionate/trans-cinnamate dioxygenase ferredoxin subunit
MSDVKVTIRKNGPYLVQGLVEIRDAEGNPVGVQGSAVSLCRCGGSMNKPFCDGTHGKIGFQGALATEASCCQGEHKHEAMVMEPMAVSSCCQGEDHHEKIEAVEMPEGASCCSVDKHHHC